MISYLFNDVILYEISIRSCLYVPADESFTGGGDASGYQVVYY